MKRAVHLVNRLLENEDDVDPREFLASHPIVSVRQILDAFFNEIDSVRGRKHASDTRKPDSENIAAGFEASIRPMVRGNPENGLGKLDGKKPVHTLFNTEVYYVAVSWNIQDTDTYYMYGQGGTNQDVRLKDAEDAKALVADLSAIELAVTRDFNPDRARKLGDIIGHKIYYGAKTGYSRPDAQGKSKPRKASL